MLDGCCQMVERSSGSTERDNATQGELVHRAPDRDLDEVNATTVVLERSGAETITADTLRMDRSGARSIDARSVEMDRSGTVALGSDHAVLRSSSAVQVVADQVELVQSKAVFVSAREARIDRSNIVLFAGSASGDVRALLTPVTAGVLGGAFALVVMIMSAFFRSRGSGND
jgi:hypothetical protein